MNENDIEIEELIEEELLGLLILDNSKSMKNPGLTGISKQNEIDYMIKDLIFRLQHSSHKYEYLLGMVTYEDVEIKILEPTKVTEINVLSYNSAKNNNRKYGKNIENALEIIDEFLSKVDFDRQVLIVLITDGKKLIEDPINIAYRINEILKNEKRIRFHTFIYGKDNDVDLSILHKLKKIQQIL